jgi:thiol-disulfide isomerase/thioredoxin
MASITYAANLEEGKPAVDFKLSSIDGEEYTLESFKGKTLLINFWATWCPPCLLEMPSLERLQQLKKKDNLVVIAINADEGGSLTAVKRVIKEQGLSLLVLLDPTGSLPSKLGITGFPETFFIDKEGKFMAVVDPETGKKSVRLISDRAWDSKLYLKMIDQMLEADKK